MTSGSRIRVRLDARGTWANGKIGHVVGPSAFGDDRVDVVFEEDPAKRPTPMPIALLEEATGDTWQQVTTGVELEPCPDTLPAGPCSEPAIGGAE